MSNIISAGNLTCSGNAILNSDNTKTTIINGLTTINNNLICKNLNCADITSSGGSLTTSNINNSDTINTKYLQLFPNIYITSVNGNTLSLNSNSEIVFFINGVEKARINASNINTYQITTTYGIITNFQATNATINYLNYLLKCAFKPNMYIDYTNSPDKMHFWVNGNKQLSIGDGNTEILHDLTVDNDLTVNNNLICNNTITSAGDITTNGFNKSYGFYLNYTNMDKPTYTEKNIGYVYTQSYGPQFISSAATITNAYSYTLSTGNWMVIINYKIAQFYNIEYSIYYFALAGNSTDYQLFGLSSTQYMDKLIINNYYSIPQVYYINIEGNLPRTVYTNFRILSNNYTSLTVECETKYIRIG